MVREDHLRSGATSSCGCIQKEVLRERSLRHGHANVGKISPTYKTWESMMRRGRGTDPEKRKYYIERGITVCERWMKFENFLADMGERPNGASLDRIDVNGGYEPENCRWATQRQQSRNRRNNRILEFDGRAQPVADWAEYLGINQGTILSRLRAGWSVESALFKPIRRKAA